MNSINQIRRFFSYHKKLSYAHGVGLNKLMYQTIGDKLREQRDKFPEHLALASHQQNRIFTYSELCDQAEHIAAALRKLGLKKYDRVGLYSPNNYEWVLIQYACSMAQLILVNINPSYELNELEYCLGKVNCKALFTANQFRLSNNINMINNICPELQKSQQGQLDSKRLPDLKYIIRIDEEQSPGMYNFKDLYDIAGTNEINEIRDISSQIDPDSPTNIQFTSGTTGIPKGATLTHFNLLNNAQQIGQRQRLTDKDRICLPVPLYHCFGMVLGNLTALCYGSGMVLPSDDFNAKQTLDAVTKYKCSALYGVPSMFIEYIKEYQQNKNSFDISNLRTGVMAGTLCPKPLMEKVVNILNMKDITICYGMTETSPVTFQTNQDDNYEDRCGTVGTIFPHIEAKIVDQETHQILPINKPGQLCIRGYSVMQKYYNDIVKTKDSIDENQWLQTGDIAQMDERGYLKVIGRIKEIIIRGEEIVFPKEVEDFIMRMPGIVDIQVVGIPDKKLGQEVFALIKVNDANFNIKKVYEYCHGYIAHYKIPKYVKIVNEYPVTILGKYQKYKMVEALIQEMNGNQLNFDKYKISKK